MRVSLSKLLLILILSSTVQQRTVEHYLNAPGVVLGDDSSDNPITSVYSYCFQSPDTFFILDRRSHCVIALSSNGGELYRFGRQGLGPSEFINPISICSSETRLFVADASMSRITEFTHSGEYCRTIGLHSIPTDIVWWDGNLYVSSNGGDSIVWKVPYNNTREQSILLSWKHKKLRGFEPICRTGNNYLDVSDNELIVSIPACFTLVLINIDDQHSTHFIEPSSQYISNYAEWWYPLEKRNKREDVKATAAPFGPATRWYDGNIFLEQYPKDRQTFSTVGVVIDRDNGEDTGIHIGFHEGIYTYMQIVNDTEIAWIKEYESVCLYNINAIRFNR